MLDYPLSLLARVLDGRLQGPGETVVRRVVTDSREVQAGDLFVAVKGERVDGHRFVPEVLGKGASALVRSDDLPSGAAGAPGLLIVPDPVTALGQLGAWHRNRFNVRMVAVTGSVGKTTTKDLIAAVLGQQWKTLKSPGNRNTEIGLALALLNLRAEHQAAVVELAMRGVGQIRGLAWMARPEIAAITNIGLSHIEVLGSQQAIAEAKVEVLDFLPAGGTAVLNEDDAHFEFLRSRVPPDARVLPYGITRSGRDSMIGMYLGAGEQGGVLGARFTLRAARDKNVHRAWIPLLGRHNVCNALAAAAVGHALGISPLRLRRGLAEAEISGMRMALHRLADGTTLLDDAYNASSPEAMEGALEVLSELDGIRKVAVLGDMLELGPASEAAHRRIGEYVARVKPHLLVTVGKGGALIAEAAREYGLETGRITVCGDNDEVVRTLDQQRRPGDVLLIKGSRGMAMEAVVSALRGANVERSRAA